LSTESRAAVDDILHKAKDAGATLCGEPKDYGFMYSQSFQDLDGHIWTYVWMDPSALRNDRQF
jgi:predicted lactoylglutathione lyase